MHTFRLLAVILTVVVTVLSVAYLLFDNVPSIYRNLPLWFSGIISAMFIAQLPVALLNLMMFIAGIALAIREQFRTDSQARNRMLMYALQGFGLFVLVICLWFGTHLQLESQTFPNNGGPI